MFHHNEDIYADTQILPLFALALVPQERSILVRSLHVLLPRRRRLSESQPHSPPITHPHSS